MHMLEAEFRESVMNSPVLSSSLKQTLTEEAANMTEGERLSLYELISSMEQAVGLGAEEFLAIYQNGDIMQLLPKE